MKCYINADLPPVYRGHSGIPGDTSNIKPQIFPMCVVVASLGIGVSDFTAHSPSRGLLIYPHCIPEYSEYTDFVTGWSN